MFDENLRSAIPVVFAFAAFWQPVGVDLRKTPLQEPMHRARGQNEDTVQTRRFGALLDSLEYAFPIALALGDRRHRQCRHFTGFGVWVWV